VGAADVDAKSKMFTLRFFISRGGAEKNWFIQLRAILLFVVDKF
jgi:hypothetical protein